MSGADRDRGSVVIGWLVRLVAALVLFSVCAFDAISVAVAHVSGTDDANGAAFAAADTWRDTHNIDQAVEAARAAAGNNETVLTKGFTIDPDGTVHLVMEKTATTLVMYRIGPLKKYTLVTLQGESGPPA